jgi:hypothetical protein
MMQDFSVAAEKHIQKALATLNLPSLDQAPPDIRKSLLREARQIARNDVFGHGHKVGKDGKPIEQGLGSHDNPTQQSIDAYIRAQQPPYRAAPEPGYEETLKKMRQRLAEVEAQRAKVRAANDEDF